MLYYSSVLKVHCSSVLQVLSAAYQMITLNSGQHMIEARRRSENAYRDMEAVTAHMRKVQLRTDFEITTTNKIERKMKQVTTRY